MEKQSEDEENAGVGGRDGEVTAEEFEMEEKNLGVQEGIWGLRSLVSEENLGPRRGL